MVRPPPGDGDDTNGGGTPGDETDVDGNVPDENDLGGGIPIGGCDIDTDTDTSTDTDEVVVPVVQGPEVVAPAVPAFTPAPAPVAAAPDAPETVVMGVAVEADTLPATGTGSSVLALLAGLLLLAGAGALRMTRSATVTTQ